MIHEISGLKAGQPAFNPADLLALYLYGYLNRVRSSRRLEAECVRNLEVIWLLNGVRPGYHTIEDFRKDNGRIADHFWCGGVHRAVRGTPASAGHR